MLITAAAKIRRSVVATALALATLTLSHAGPVGAPLGGELLLDSTSLALDQVAPAAARDADGDSVVVWQGAASASDTNIYMRQINSFGALKGTADVLVNTTTAGNQSRPAVAMAPGGSFVVVWESDAQDGDLLGVYGQRYSAAGALQGSEFKVNTFTTEIQGAPSVAVGGDGSFVVAWESRTQDGAGYGIYAQRYNAAGVVQGAEFRVNTAAANSQRAPSVAADLNGNFVVAWQSSAQDGDLNGIYAQRYMADGTAVGGEFRLNSITTGDQSAPSIALRADGQLLASWTGPDAAGTGIYMRRFSASNAALDAADVLVNTTTADTQAAPSIATDVDGDTVVAWESNAQDAPGGTGIYFQRFSASGLAAGVETLANATTAGNQSAASIAVDADSDVLVAWAGNGAGDTSGVFARRFTGPEAVDLSITKTDAADPVMPTGNITYTIAVTNLHAVSTATGNAAIDTGIGSATNVVVTDTLPAGVTFTSATGTNWTCANVAGVVTCTYGSTANALPLAAGASGSITVVVATGVTAPANNQLVNNATVAADQFDAVSTNNAAAETTNVCGPTDNVGTFSVADASVTEGTATATITVTRTTASAGQLLCGPATVRYATSDGTALAPADYTSSSGTLSFPDSAAAAPGTGSDSQTMSFTVPIADDALDENVETVNLTLSKPSTGTLARAAGVLSIMDNDAPPSVSITTPSVSVPESAGTQTLTLTLSAPSGRDVTVPYTHAGTASNGGTNSDYTVSPVGQVTIPAGSTTASITLNIVDDARNEDDETVITTLTNASGGDPTYARATPFTQTTTITDNDPLPAASIANSSLTEGDSSSAMMVFTVTLATVSGRDVSFHYATVDGTAKAGSDYTSSSGTVTISAGSTSNTINVPVLGDLLDEDDETFSLTLSAPMNATITAPATATGTILDNDPTPTVSFTAASQAVAENVSGGTATITATLSAASGKTVTAPFTLGGTATLGMGADYTLTPASPITFNPGDTSKQLTVSINNDTLNEANETVVATLTAPTNAALGTTSTHTLTINDDDPTPTVSFSTAAQSVMENVASGTATITVTLSAVSGQDVTVPYTVGGTATPSSDYSLSPASPLKIAAGNTTATITVSIVNDVIQEPNETVVLTIGTPSNATVGSNGTHTLTILDDDTFPQVFFERASQTFGEGGGTATVAIRLSRTADDDITLNYSVSGTATQGNTADYKAITPANPIVISAGTPASGVTLNIPINDDALVEGDETVVITLTSAVNGTLISPSSHTLTIADNDTAGVVVTESGGSTQVTEGGATDNYTLKLSSQPSMDVTISVASTTQATAAPSSLTFTSANWNVPQTVTVTAVDDAVAEGNHSTILNQAASSGDMRYSGIAVPSVTVNITDNDTAGVSVVESGGATTVTEGGATDNYTLVLTTQPSADVSFSITPDAQVTVSRSSVTFTNANWNVPQSVTVTAVDDAKAEGSHTGRILHGNTVSTDASYSGLTVTGVTAQITDNDTAGLTFSTGSVNVTEGGATASYTVRLKSQPSASVTVALDGASQLQVSSGGSAPAQTLNLSFTPNTGMPGGWDVPQTVVVQAVDDNVAEGTHSGMVTHSASSTDSGYKLPMAGLVNATINDNDTATISINDVTVTEGNSGTTNANFKVSLSTPSSATVRVDYITQAGTATEGIDYQKAVGTLTIPAGATSGTISIGVVGDTLNEDDETYAVLLSNAVGATLADARGDGLIRNDDAPPSVTLSASGSPLAENGGTAMVTATLSAASSKAVVVNLAYSGTASNTVDYSRSADSITIAAGATSGSVNIASINDAVDEANETVIVDIASVSNGSEQGVQQSTLVITDDDTAGLLLMESGGSTAVTEGSGSDTYTVTLTSQPSAGTVTVSVSADAPLMANPGALMFNASNWNTPQTVTLSAANDRSAGGNRTLNVSNSSTASNDANYAGLVSNVSVSFTDTDSVGVAASKTAVSVAAGGTGDSYTLQLASRPTATVTLTLRASTDASLSPGTLMFDASNWNVAQTVNVSAASTGKGNRSGTISTTVSSADSGYSGLAVANVAVSISDSLPTGSVGGGAFGAFGLMGLLGLRRLRKVLGLTA